MPDLCFGLFIVFCFVVLFIPVYIAGEIGGDS